MRCTPSTITRSPPLAESAFDDTLSVDIAAQLEVALLGAIAFADDIDIAAILIGEHGFIVDEQGIRVMAAHELHARIQARRESVIRIGDPHARGSCRSRDRAGC